MNGIKKEFGYPIIRDGETTAIRDEEKAEMLVKNFVKIHNSILVKREKEEGKVHWRSIKNYYRMRNTIMTN